VHLSGTHFPDFLLDTCTCSFIPHYLCHYRSKMDPPSRSKRTHREVARRGWGQVEGNGLRVYRGAQHCRQLPFGRQEWIHVGPGHSFLARRSRSETSSNGAHRSRYA
jgi:hypothetical protein